MFEIVKPGTPTNGLRTEQRSLGSVLGLSGVARPAATAPRTGYETTAAFGTGSLPQGGSSINVGGLTTGINLDPMLWEVAPEQLDEEQFPYQLTRLYRDIYYFDSVAGAAVDLYSGLPFSNWTLGGMEDHKLAKFQETLERLNIQNLMPALVTDYLVIGAFLSILLYNSQTKLFTDTICLQPEHCQFTRLPFFGQDPLIEYTVPDSLRRFTNLKSARAQSSLDRMGENLKNKFKKGKFELSPLTTLFIPRQSMSHRIGSSWLKRILPIYLVEKNLWKGTMIEATRRIRSILHVQIGDTDWEPTEEQINAIGSLFTQADADPIGSVVATRAGVNSQDVRSGGDFWSIFNIWGDTVPAKLRAVGLSEAFLSGDVSLANMETSVSVFTDGLRSFRSNITNQVFYSKIFPIISLANGYLKKDQKMPREFQKIDGSIPVEDLLRAAQDTNSLELPELHWTKTLEPKGDQAYMEMLEKMEEKGVPVGIRAWAAAGGIDLDDAIREADTDLKMRTDLAQMLQKRSKVLEKFGQPKEGPGGADDQDFQGEFSDGMEGVKRRRNAAQNGGFRTTANAAVNRVGIVNRDYGELRELRRQSKSGNSWHAIPASVEKALQKKLNGMIARAISNHEQQQAKRSRSKPAGGKPLIVPITK